MIDKLRKGIFELYKKVATSIPPDVEQALRQAHDAEPEGSASRNTLAAIIEDIRTSRGDVRPLCMGSGIPVFYVKVPRGLSHKEIRDTIAEATRQATEKIPLSGNAVNVLTNLNTGNSVGEGIPIVHLEETEEGSLVVELMLKSSTGDSVGSTYALPDGRIGAERSLEGVGQCVIDAVKHASGLGCPPYTIGVGIGATKEIAVMLSSRQLFRRLNDQNPIAELQGLEGELLTKINSMGIGSGATLALGVKVGLSHRHPSALFVDVTFSCWANRRGTLIW